MNRHLIRAIAVLSFVVSLLAAGTSSAAADSLNVSVSSATPTRGIPITVTFSGADTPYDSSGDTPYLYALVRPANGIPCQPTYGADAQVAGSDNYTQLENGKTVNSGNFTDSASITPVAGTYIVCVWLEKAYDGPGDGRTSSDVTATATTSYATQSIDRLGIGVSTLAPTQGVPLTVTFSGADTPYDTGGDTPQLYALARPANGIPCQPTYGADAQVAGSDNYTELENGNPVSSGSYSESASYTPVAGTYIVCAWLETTSDGPGDGRTPSEVTATTQALIVTPGTILPHTATATNNAIKLKVGCRVVPCQLTLDLVAAVRSHGRTKQEVVAKDSLQIAQAPAGKSQGLTVTTRAKLTSTGRRYLAHRRGHIKLKLQVRETASHRTLRSSTSVNVALDSTSPALRMQ